MKILVPAPEATMISDALWGLRRPPAERGEKDSKYLFPWFKGLDNSLWLMVDTEYAFDVDGNADAEPIVDRLQSCENSGALPAGTLAALKLRVEELRGKRMVVYDEFPALFKQQTESNPAGLGRTMEQLIASGTLPQPILP